jgi:tRNA modification GTPase
MDTIFALATARAKSGVAVIRISGPEAHAAAVALAGPLPDAGRRLVRLRDHAGRLIDEALVLTFETGHSFTGEPVAEIQCHGSTAVIQAIEAALVKAGMRPAAPGEFTRRAFENGRLDLAQVEALADLIEAETEAQRRAAVQQMTGALKALADTLRGQLVRAAALIAATIDFADEDVPIDVAPEVLALIDAALPPLLREVNGFGAAERLRQGFEVVILGRPNAGKSTLLNAIAGREAAITAATPGTTRDMIEVRVDLGGLPVTFVDTAGLRQAEDDVERIGVVRAMARARAADLRLVLLDETGTVPFLDVEGLSGDIFRRTKIDTLPPGTCPAGAGISALTGEGVADLLADVRQRLETRVAGAGAINRSRHLDAVSTAIRALESARDEVRAGSDRAEFAAEDLRRAVNALDSLIGRVDVETLLDEIFASFCIGK